MTTLNTIREGERREATIMFADLSGFTSMSEKLDPEELTNIVNECMQLMGTSIVKYGGTIDKYIGDCVMALFGVPHSLEEAPKNAVHASIEILEKIKKFSASKNLTHSINVHTGINTGIVVTGFIGSTAKKEFTVMGDAVNIASRLKDASAAGQIFVGPDTYRYTKQDFTYKPIEPILLKGKEKELVVYELLTKKGSSKRSFQPDRMISSSLVGRDRELDTLSLHLLKVIHGEGSIINVIGEAGIGKSRLITEFRGKEELNRVLLLEGQAESLGENLSYHLFTSLMRQWAGIRKEDSEANAYQKVESLVRNIHQEESDDLFPFIATMMGYKLYGNYAKRIEDIEGIALEKLVIKSLETLFKKVTSSKPVVIILEDLHWTDLTSAAILESLYRLVENYSILFINVLRPRYEKTGEKILDTIKSRFSSLSTTLMLEPLPDAVSEVLIQNLLKVDGFPEKTKDLIIRRTGGNPFFIEEILRSFIDDGIIKISNEKFVFSKQIENISIPHSINEVIMARIDKLDEETRELLKIASVIGRNFYYRILTSLTDSMDEMDTKMNFLEDIQLITKQSNKEEIAYVFKHALAQEATYESILFKKRKELHLKTAQAIEHIFEDNLNEFYGMLALHYSKGGNHEKAENYLLKAGEEALRTAASSEAIHYYHEALQLYLNKYGKDADQKKIAHMEKNIGIALKNKGLFEEAIPYFHRVLLYEGFTLPENRIKKILVMVNGLFHLLIGIYLPVLKWRKKASDHDVAITNILVQQLGCVAMVDPLEGGVLGMQLARWLTKFDLSNTKGGTEYLCMVGVLFTHAGISFKLSRDVINFAGRKLNPDNSREIFEFKFIESVIDRMEGNYVDHPYDPECISYGLQYGLLHETNSYLIMRFFIDLGLGNFNDAQAKIEKLKEIHETFNNRTAKSWALTATAKLSIKERKLNKALKEIDTSIKASQQDNETGELYWCYSTKAYIQLLLKDISGAEISMEKAKLYEMKRIFPVYETTYALAKFRIDLHHLEIAAEKDNHYHYVKARKLAYNSMNRGLIAGKKTAEDRVEFYNLAGQYYWITGKSGKAFKFWEKGIAEGKRLNARPEMARTYMEMWLRLRKADKNDFGKDEKTVNFYFDKAKELFTELGLKYDLNELEKEAHFVIDY